MAHRGVVRPPYPEVLRLHGIAAEHWALIDAHYPSVNLIEFPVHRFLDFVYAWLMNRIDPEKMEEVDDMLNRPLPGQERKVTDAMAEDEGASFMALHAGLGD